MKSCIIIILSICLLIGGCKEGSTDTKILSVSSASATELASINTCPMNAVTLVSWNALNFGFKKSDDTINLMAKILLSKGIEYKDQSKVVADIILLQEVNSRVQSGGPQAVARIQNALGQDWDYLISNPTSGDGIERYGTLFRKKLFIINRNEAHLIQDIAKVVNREPFAVKFQLKESNEVFWTYGFHAVPTVKDPITEINNLITSQELANSDNAILAGDFNLGNQVRGIMQGWQNHIDEKTSIGSIINKKGEYLRFQYDHIFTKGKIKVCESGTINFVSAHFIPVNQSSLDAARKVSDHLPVYIRFTLH